VDSDLSEVSIPPVLVITEHGQLEHKSTDGPISDVFEKDLDPSTRLCNLNNFHLLEVIEMSATTNRDLAWGVALVQFEVRVNADVTNRHFTTELNIDQVRQLTV
jgi:hypothetical protein